MHLGLVPLASSKLRVQHRHESASLHHAKILTTFGHRAVRIYPKQCRAFASLS